MKNTFKTKKKNLSTPLLERRCDSPKAFATSSAVRPFEVVKVRSSVAAFPEENTPLSVWRFVAQKSSVEKLVQCLVLKGLKAPEIIGFCAMFWMNILDTAGLNLSWGKSKVWRGQIEKHANVYNLQCSDVLFMMFLDTPRPKCLYYTKDISPDFEESFCVPLYYDSQGTSRFSSWVVNPFWLILSLKNPFSSIFTNYAVAQRNCLKSRFCHTGLEAATR